VLVAIFRTKPIQIRVFQSPTQRSSRRHAQEFRTNATGAALATNCSAIATTLDQRSFRVCDSGPPPNRGDHQISPLRTFKRTIAPSPVLWLSGQLVVGSPASTWATLPSRPPPGTTSTNDGPRQSSANLPYLSLASVPLLGGPLEKLGRTIPATIPYWENRGNNFRSPASVKRTRPDRVAADNPHHISLDLPTSGTPALVIPTIHKFFFVTGSWPTTTFTPLRFFSPRTCFGRQSASLPSSLPTTESHRFLAPARSKDLIAPSYTSTERASFVVEAIVTRSPGTIPAPAVGYSIVSAKLAIALRLGRAANHIVPVATLGKSSSGGGPRASTQQQFHRRLKTRGRANLGMGLRDLTGTLILDAVLDIGSFPSLRELWQRECPIHKHLT